MIATSADFCLAMIILPSDPTVPWYAFRLLEPPWLRMADEETLGYILGDRDDCDDYVSCALALNPNVAAAWFVSSWLKTCRGELETATDHAARAMRLSPLDPATRGSWDHIPR